ncbi:hypothetical protein TWF281_005057 [Arthrobotrys megalospora]
MKISIIAYAALLGASTVFGHEADYYINNARKAKFPNIDKCNDWWNDHLGTFRNLAQKRFLALEACNKNVESYKTKLKDSDGKLAACKANSGSKTATVTITTTCTTTATIAAKTVTVTIDPEVLSYKRRVRRH